MSSTLFKNLIGQIYQFTIAVKLIHWQTDSYALHKTTDALLITLDPVFDQLVETIQGELETKVNIKNNPINLVLNDMSNVSYNEIINIINTLRNFLREEMIKELQESGASNLSAINNIIDTITAELEKTKYLLGFN